MYFNRTNADSKIYGLTLDTITSCCTPTNGIYLRQIRGGKLTNSFLLGTDALNVSSVEQFDMDGTNWIEAGTTEVSPSLASVLPIKTVTFAMSTYFTTASDYTILCDSTLGSPVISLNTAILGQVINIKKIAAANTCWIGSNGPTIDGAASASLTTLNSAKSMQFDGVGWQVISVK